MKLSSALISICASVVLLVGCQSPELSSSRTETASLERLPASGPHLDASGYLYDAADTSCDGFPRLKVETAPGTCLGLVLPKERAYDSVAKRGFSMPRTLVEIPGTKDFLVSDLGSWHPGRGTLWRLVWSTSGYSAHLLKAGLNFPHAVRVGPDGKFWIGELAQISRFALSSAGAVVDWEIVVSGLPAWGDDSHPLSQFVFDPRNNDLYINSGAPSDHCFVKAPFAAEECPEVVGKDLAGILKVPWAPLVHPPAGGYQHWTDVAIGLRNSMAMAISPAGYLVQGENSRDFTDISEPYEEMNVVNLEGLQGFHYGWPYCYNFNATSPEWDHNKVVQCSLGTVPDNVGMYQKPYVLIPPHAAPLSSLYYHGAMFPSLEGQLLMAWHGYRPTGHRLVAYPVDAKGLPVLATGSGAPTFNFDRTGDACAVKKPFDPRGGLLRSAPYSELVTRWNERKGLRPLGAPSSVYVANDGSIWMTEDKNQVVVRLARTSAPFVAESCYADADDRIELLAWRRAVSQSTNLSADFSALSSSLVSKYCASCHDGGLDKSLADDSYSGLDFLVKSKWFVPGAPDKSKALQASMHQGTTPPMPLAGSPQFLGTAEGDALIALMKKWIGEGPTDIDARYAKTHLASSRKVRSSPSLKGAVCGQLAAGTTAYIDPRATSVVRADGWKWTPLYLPPDHKALVGSACKWPSDGVFYVATQSAP